MDPIIRHLSKSERVLIASHANPDGDAVGSLLAMGLALQALDKNVTLYNESPIPAVYRFLPLVERVTRRIAPGTAFDVAVIVDCGNLKRIGAAASLVEKSPCIINIDHHVTNTNFGDLKLIDTRACASAEIVHRLIKGLGVPLDEPMATALYTGILTDTGSFRFSNTNRAAFSICEEMVGLGVNPFTVAQYVYGKYSLGRLKLLNMALDSIEISRNGKLSMMALTQKMMEATDTRSEDIDGLINYARRIEDVMVAVLIQERRNGGKIPGDRRSYHVSLRSDGSVDVAAIASAFGGGGHSSAAGFNVESTLSDLKSEIMRITEWM
ncbi:MAG: bifunctional oligoribonuclease/PAP phosphatase NrnA [Desulfobacterales bacterium]|nr:bifunctional oligoribonuclease/PAP phosphatase NrnA [Desulfobacterales bacterium]